MGEAARLLSSNQLVCCDGLSHEARNETTPAKDLLHNLLKPETRAVLLAAHPDDETIGATATLMRLHDVFVVYLTDGAPSDRKFWPATQKSREEYVLTRRRRG